MGSIAKTGVSLTIRRVGETRYMQLRLAWQMRRQTAIRLYGLLVVVQVLSICAGLIEMISDPRSSLREFLPASLIGICVGIALTILWYRQMKRVQAVPEEQWDRAWFINPPKS